MKQVLDTFCQPEEKFVNEYKQKLGIENWNDIRKTSESVNMDIRKKTINGKTYFFKFDKEYEKVKEIYLQSLLATKNKDDIILKILACGKRVSIEKDRHGEEFEAIWHVFVYEQGISLIENMNYIKSGGLNLKLQIMYDILRGYEIYNENGICHNNIRFDTLLFLPNNIDKVLIAKNMWIRTAEYYINKNGKNSLGASVVRGGHKKYSCTEYHVVAAFLIILQAHLYLNIDIQTAVKDYKENEFYFHKSFCCSSNNKHLGNLRPLKLPPNQVNEKEEAIFDVFCPYLMHKEDFSKTAYKEMKENLSKIRTVASS